MTCNCCNSRLELRRINDQWTMCNTCGVYINLQFSDTPIQEASGIRQVPREIINDVSKFVPILNRLDARGPLFDVCSGYGALPYLCKLRNIPASGNEISPGAITLAKELFGVDLQYGHFEDTVHGHIYREIVFHHGIEHVVNPRKAMYEAIGMLMAGGQIYLAHPAMRDVNWVIQYGSSGHRFEWTVNAFARFLHQFVGVTVVGCDRSEFSDGGGASQWWWLRKDE